MTRKYLTTELTGTDCAMPGHVLKLPRSNHQPVWGDKRSANWKWKMIANTDQIGRAGRGGRRYQLLSYVIKATTIMFPVFSCRSTAMSHSVYIQISIQWTELAIICYIHYTTSCIEECSKAANLWLCHCYLYCHTKLGFIFQLSTFRSEFHDELVWPGSAR